MSSEIKNTIGLLCKLLNLLYRTNLKPDHFRLAKFNKTDDNVGFVLWNLLVTILNEDVNVNTNNIERKLFNLNYKRRQFYLSTEKHSQSRELLLAVGFLIANSLEDAVHGELKTSAFCEDYEPFGSFNPCSQYMVNYHQQFNWEKLNHDDLNNYKKWICGKIISNKNMIIEHQEYIFKMQNKLNKVLDMKANGTLTVYEILALTNKTIGEQFIRDTDPVLNVLSVYSEWLKKEKHFWKWMETVLLEERNKIKSKHADKGCTT